MEPVETFEWDDKNSPSLALIMAISDLMDVHPTELEPLYPAISPDALDEIFSPLQQAEGRLKGRVEFEYYGYRIEIRGNGKGYIYPSEGSLDWANELSPTHHESE